MNKTFVIGDIHGCARELKILWTYLLEKAGFDVNVDKLIFLGDYIDRGPESKQVIDFCVSLQKQVQKTVFLKGNHEDMFLDFLGENGRSGEYFIQNGGDKTLHSYNAVYFKSSTKIREKDKAAIPKEHLEFFLSLKNYHIEDKYIFIHAGVNPKLPLDKQDVSNFFWQRDQFYDFIEYYHKDFGERTFIHGHTPVGVEFRLPYRINLDSGCVFGGMKILDDSICALSCMQLDYDNPINSIVYQVQYGKSDVSILNNSLCSWPV